MCPTCGIANRTALPANVENGKDEEVEKEMEDIVSQMSIKVNNREIMSISKLSLCIFLV